MKTIYKATVECFDELQGEPPKHPDWTYSNYFESEEDADAFCGKAVELCLSVYRSKHSDMTLKEESKPDGIGLYDENGYIMFAVLYKVEKLETVSSESAYDDMIHRNRNNHFFDDIKFDYEEENELIENERLCMEVEQLLDPEQSVLAKDFFSDDDDDEPEDKPVEMSCKEFLGDEYAGDMNVTPESFFGLPPLENK